MSDYASIRDPALLGLLIGQTVVDITQQDADEFRDTRESFVFLHFGNGMALRFPIGDAGFDVLNHPSQDDDNPTDGETRA